MEKTVYILAMMSNSHVMKTCLSPADNLNQRRLKIEDACIHKSLGFLNDFLSDQPANYPPLTQILLADLLAFILLLIDRGKLYQGHPIIDRIDKMLKPFYFVWAIKSFKYGLFKWRYLGKIWTRES